eukprot:PLAT9501.2.p2 GENE.PLAT9501.2~~PLAT9501.2.p2  ORF type:complete len:239 (-),score=125.32 PLAT9501.2:57-773(-)
MFGNERIFPVGFRLAGLLLFALGMLLVWLVCTRFVFRLLASVFVSFHKYSHGAKQPQGLAPYWDSLPRASLEEELRSRTCRPERRRRVRKALRKLLRQAAKEGVEAGPTYCIGDRRLHGVASYDMMQNPEYARDFGLDSEEYARLRQPAAHAMADMDSDDEEDGKSSGDITVEDVDVDHISKEDEVDEETEEGEEEEEEEDDGYDGEGEGDMAGDEEVDVDDVDDIVVDDVDDDEGEV